MKGKLEILTGMDGDRLVLRASAAHVSWSMRGHAMEAVLGPEIVISASANVRLRPLEGRSEVSTRSQGMQLARALREIAAQVEYQSREHEFASGRAPIKASELAHPDRLTNQP